MSQDTVIETVLEEGAEVEYEHESWGRCRGRVLRVEAWGVLVQDLAPGGAREWVRRAQFVTGAGALEGDQVLEGELVAGAGAPEGDQVLKGELVAGDQVLELVVDDVHAAPGTDGELDPAEDLAGVLMLAGLQVEPGELAPEYPRTWSNETSCFCSSCGVVLAEVVDGVWTNTEDVCDPACAFRYRGELALLRCEECEVELRAPATAEDQWWPCPDCGEGMTLQPALVLALRAALPGWRVSATVDGVEVECPELEALGVGAFDLAQEEGDRWRLSSGLEHVEPVPDELVVEEEVPAAMVRRAAVSMDRLRAFGRALATVAADERGCFEKLMQDFEGRA